MTLKITITNLNSKHFADALASFAEMIRTWENLGRVEIVLETKKD